MRMDGATERIWVLHKYFSQPGLDEMTGLVCDGVTIELIKAPAGYIVGQTITVRSSWALFNSRPEIKAWAKKNKIRFSEQDLSAMNKRMRESFTSIGLSIAPGAPKGSALQQTARLLIEMGSGSADGERLIQENLGYIRANSPSQGPVDDLLRPFVRSQAYFILVSPEF